MQRWPPKSYSKNGNKEDESWPRKVSIWRMFISILMRNSNLFSLLVWILLFSTFFTLLSIYELKTIEYELLNQPRQLNIERHVESYVPPVQRKPVAWIRASKPYSGYLDHVFVVLERLGYETIINKTQDWDLLWSHTYPFVESEQLSLRPYQLVNHFPGTGFITSKVTLTSVNSQYIPKAFKIPNSKDQFLTYAKQFPNKLWVQKSNNHRGIKIEKLSELDLSQSDTFIQEFIDKPLLIDGRKFDIGIYTMLTSLDPLRVYLYEGDVLFRFCPEDYLPFDPAKVDKYVVRDDYTPTWEMPSLKKLYSEHGFTHKESFNTYMRSLGKDPELIWQQARNAIRTIFYSQLNAIIETIEYYNFKPNRNFFEMMRFDLIIDENFKVFIMEANMSPNLSSDHFKPNKLIYEQVLFNLFSLVGVASALHKETLEYRSVDGWNMQVSDKDIHVFADLCFSQKCLHGCSLHECRVCESCLAEEERRIIKASYLEHVNRRNCRRILPEPLPLNPKTQDFSKVNDKYINISTKNKLLARWFQGKCIQDVTWCI